MNRRSIQILLGACVCALGGVSCAPDAQPEPSKTSATSPNPVVATVLGKQILESDLAPPESLVAFWKREGKDTEAQRAETRNLTLVRAIWDPLRARFVAENNAAPSEAEIEAIREQIAASSRERTDDLVEVRANLIKEVNLRKQEADDPATTSARREELLAEIALANEILEKSPSQRGAEWFGGNYKFQQALYKKYGGRVIWQQVGPEAPDAMHLWLKECAARGDFNFASESDAAAFGARFPGPSARISHQLDNPDEVFESIQKYIELNDDAKKRASQ